MKRTQIFKRKVVRSIWTIKENLIELLREKGINYIDSKDDYLHVQYMDSDGIESYVKLDIFDIRGIIDFVSILETKDLKK